MNDQQFKFTWDLLLSVSRTAQFIPVEDVRELLNVVSQSHAIGPLIDPTKYRDGGMDNLEEQKVLAEGFLAFRTAIEKVRQLGLERQK